MVRYLNGFDISGPLPDFSSMDALQIMLVKKDDHYI